jgi:integrase
MLRQGRVLPQLSIGQNHQAPSRVLRSALSSAMTEGLVSRDIATMVKAPRSRPREIVPWTSEEARWFLESARNDGDSLYAVFVLVLVLGLRKAEVLGLRRSAVDVEGLELTIGQQLQRVRRELLVAVIRCGNRQSNGPTLEGAGPLTCENAGRGDRI